jgi:hypothetical protein
VIQKLIQGVKNIGWFIGVLIAAAVAWVSLKTKDQDKVRQHEYQNMWIQQRVNAWKEGDHEIHRTITKLEQTYPRLPSDPIIDSHNLAKRLEGLSAAWYQYQKDINGHDEDK